MSQVARFEIRLPLGPRWQNIELIRSAILNCVAAVFLDTDASHSVSVVAGELLENAVKYGAWQRGGDSCIVLRVQGDRDAVEIEITNPVASAKAAEPLFETIEMLNGYDSPRAAYHGRLRELADGGDEGISRLGLARIAYEGNAQLHAKHENGTVTVRAICRPSGAEPPRHTSSRPSSEA